MLSPIHKIQPPQWMQNPNLIRVLDTLNHDGLNARMVGGCIRNEFMNKDVYDIDITCKFDVSETIEILTQADIRTIPTGIKHGTVTAHIDGQNFEITMLRTDIETDGRHAKIAGTDSWIEDAKRRDFTINALYADRDGSIYDPLGTGFDDLQNHIVRFIGNADKRISEDALRILRYFRFHADYHDGSPDEKSFIACKNNKDKINGLSDERIYDELFKILKSDNAPRAIEAMSDAKIFDFKPNSVEHLKSLITLQNQLNLIDLTTRYFLILNNKKHIKNNTQKQFLKQLNEFLINDFKSIKHSLYHYNRDILIQGLLIKKAQGEDVTDIMISDAINIHKPELPITATDVMDAFKIPQGQEVGLKLKQGESIWIESEFKLNRYDLLEKLRPFCNGGE